MRHENAYEKMKSKNKTGFDFSSVKKSETPYWAGAAGISMLFFGLIDGGLSVAIAYGAMKAKDAL